MGKKFMYNTDMNKLYDIFSPIGHNHDNRYALLSHSHTWDSITGKPSTYTPSSHTHDDRYAPLSHIHTEYIKGLSVSGKVITYTKGDGTTDTITTQDTNTTYTLSSFGITASATELNYCDGVTSNIQTQLNGKSGTSHTHSNYANATWTNTTSFSTAYSNAKSEIMIAVYGDNVCLPIYIPKPSLVSDGRWFIAGAVNPSGVSYYAQVLASISSATNIQFTKAGTSITASVYYYYR